MYEPYSLKEGRYYTSIHSYHEEDLIDMVDIPRIVYTYQPSYRCYQPSNE